MEQLESDASFITDHDESQMINDYEDVNTIFEAVLSYMCIYRNFSINQ
jgi:hypothetical protein